MLFRSVGEDVGKLGSFGWSNLFFNKHSRMISGNNLEYLAPEIITHGKINEKLDLWGIGVLMYELLTGRSPFEGSTQEELSKSIMKVKVRFPKDFPKLAKDLILRLLKVDPNERISIEELKSHPWFKANPPLPRIGKSMKMNVSSDGKIKYEVLSKESPNTTNIDGVSDIRLPKKETKDAQIKELSDKYNDLLKEMSKSQTVYEAKCKEVEKGKKMNNAIKQKLIISTKEVTKNSLMIMRKLTEQLQNEMLINKKKNETLTELNRKDRQISEQEIKMRLLKNEMKIEKNKKIIMSSKLEDYQEKVTNLERKYESVKQLHINLQNEIKEKQIKLENRIETIQNKLNTRYENGESSQKNIMNSIREILNEIRNRIETHNKTGEEYEEKGKECLRNNNKLLSTKYEYDSKTCDTFLKNENQLTEINDSMKPDIIKNIKRKDEYMNKLLEESKIIIVKEADKEIIKDKYENLSYLLTLQKRLIKDIIIAIDVQKNKEQILEKEMKAKKAKIEELEVQCNELITKQNVTKGTTHDQNICI